MDQPTLRHVADERALELPGSELTHAFGHPAAVGPERGAMRSHRGAAGADTCSMGAAPCPAGPKA